MKKRLPRIEEIQTAEIDEPDELPLLEPSLRRATQSPNKRSRSRGSPPGRASGNVIKPPLPARGQVAPSIVPADDSAPARFPVPTPPPSPERVEPHAMKIEGDILSQVGFPLKRIRHNFKKKFKARKLVYINMELRNGNHLLLAVPVGYEVFRFDEGRYIYDSSMRYWSLTLGEWALDYHQDISLPIRRSVPVTSIRSALARGGDIDEIVYSLNPSALHEFMQNNIIKSAIQASSIQPLLKKIFAFVIIGAIISFISLGIVLYDSGLLSRLGVGG